MMSIYPRTKYEMTDEDLNKILDACKPVPAMMIGSCLGNTPQQNVNMAWEELGRRMGFDWNTVLPINGKGSKFFSATPTETPSQRMEREAKEKEEELRQKVASLAAEIAQKQDELTKLLTP